VLKISSPIAPAAVVAIVLVAAIGVSAPVDGAYANNCVAAPKAPSPHGQHWYYRVDRSSGHKCWYLHGFLLRPHRAAKPSESHAAAAQSTIAAPAAAPPPSAKAAMPAGHGGSAARQPEVKILTVRTVQFANPPTVQALQQSTQQQTTAPPVLPASTGNENKDPPNTANSTATIDPTVDGADPLPLNAASSSPKADHAMKPEVLATIGPTEMFFLLVLGIGLATFVLGLVIKIVGGQRALPILEDPDSAWRRYRLDHRRPDLEAANALASPARTGLPGAQSKKLASTLTGPFLSGLKELEPALRALGEARQHEAA
jgi:hypothetical protein